MAKRGQGEGSISKRPDGTWWARITVGKDANGKQKQKAFYGKTRKEVQDKLTAAVNDVNNDTYIEPSSMTVEQWIYIWLNEYKKNSVKPSTFYNYQKYFGYQITPALGKYKLKDLRNDTIQKFVNDLIEKGYAYNTIKHVHNAVKMLLEQAKINDLVPKNVADNVKLPKSEKGDIRVLTPEEQVKFIEIAKQRYTGKMFILILATGLRVGEASALTWDDIDFKEGLLYVNKTRRDYYRYEDSKPVRVIDVGTPKTKSSYRDIPLLPEILTMLEDIKIRQENLKEQFGSAYEDNNLIFCTKDGKQQDPRHVRRYMEQIKERCDIEDKSKLHIHCLRHTFATRGLENGIELRVMQELLGHSSIQMTANLYTHVLSDKKKDSIMKLQNTIGI